MTVSFSGGGFSTTDTPVAVNGGTVTLAVPLYVDPGTHQIASGSVSLVIHQGSRATPARSVTIQELPALSSYGLRLGDISHAFLVWDALMLGQRINELQAEQQLTGFDASDALATLTEQLRATLLARNDVDRIYTDPTTVIADGVAADGSPLQVDAGTQDLMDRVLAVYLLNELGPSARVRHAARTLAVRAGHRTPTRADDLAAIKDLLESTATARGLVNDLANAQNEGNLLHGVVAIGKAAAEFAEPTLGPELTLQLGVAFAAYDVLDATQNALLDDYNIWQDYRHGGDPAALQRDLDQLNKHVADLKAASVNVVLGPLTDNLLKAVPNATPGSFSIMGLNLALTDADSLVTLAGLNAGEEEAQSVAALQAHPPSSSAAGLTELDGHVSVSDAQGYAGAQTSLDLCCFGAASIGIQALADPNGDYALVMPLGVVGTNYGRMSLSDEDVITGQSLGSELVNLSNINTDSTWIPQPFVASCTDADVLAPDEDDPDCD